MNPLEKLHDIEGLDLISSWPLASGWRWVIGASILLVAALIFWQIRLLIYRRSWKNDTIRKLAALENSLSDLTARETVITLSEYLRRIALERFPRHECAGLMGDEWLNWLTSHDTHQFDWNKNGSLLIEVPYAPTTKALPATQIKKLIHAAKNWVQ